MHGAHHIWDAQPAVFLFNHQSQLDVLVLGGLLRGNFAPVAKKELATNPLFGPLMRLLETAFIDRADNAQARKALEPAVERLRSGVSVVIAPEGTRSPTPSPGSFKKGAFHLAMQAGVPVVPLVFRNTGELMSRNAMIIHPGVVQVAVLPADRRLGRGTRPTSTSGSRASGSSTWTPSRTGPARTEPSPPATATARSAHRRHERASARAMGGGAPALSDR